MEEETTLRFSLRVPKELHERLAASANKNNNSLNAEMLRLLDVGLQREKEQSSDKTLVEQLLSPAMIWRVERYRAAANLPSNEEAAKRLIKYALDERESTKDILEKLWESYKQERDIRILAKEVIASHSAVNNISYGKDYVWFDTRSNESGAIDKKGRLYFSDEGQHWDGNMNYYTPAEIVLRENMLKPKKIIAPYGPLDDEIPF